MAFRYIFALFYFCSTVSAVAQTASKVERVSFYAALSKGSMETLNQQIQIINKLGGEEKKAFIAVLKMRKAEFAKGLKTKLDLFKSGGTQLEEEISKHKSNAEYRFLRLIIQENAPSILNYNDNIEEDAQLIRSAFHQLPKDTQAAVLDYCSRSKVLKKEDF